MYRICQDRHSVPDIWTRDAGNPREVSVCPVKYSYVACLSRSGLSLLVLQNLPFYQESLNTNLCSYERHLPDLLNFEFRLLLPWQGQTTRFHGLNYILNYKRRKQKGYSAKTTTVRYRDNVWEEQHRQRSKFVIKQNPSCVQPERKKVSGRGEQLRRLHWQTRGWQMLAMFVGVGSWSKQSRPPIKPPWQACIRVTDKSSYSLSARAPRCTWFWPQTVALTTTRQPTTPLVGA